MLAENSNYSKVIDTIGDALNAVTESVYQSTAIIANMAEEVLGPDYAANLERAFGDEAEGFLATIQNMANAPRGIAADAMDANTATVQKVSADLSRLGFGDDLHDDPEAGSPDGGTSESSDAS